MLVFKARETATQSFLNHGLRSYNASRTVIVSLRTGSYPLLSYPRRPIGASASALRIQRLQQISSRQVSETEDLLSKSKNAPFLFDPDSLYIISIPITTHRSYIFCNHKPSFLKGGQTLPFYVKIETKLTGLANKGWEKLKNSKVSVNQKVVTLAKKLLDTIPYDESCLQSFPAKRVMVREINEEHLKELPKTMVTGSVEDHNISADQLKPIPVYHPRFQDALAVLSQMHLFKDQFGSYHRRWAFWSAIGIPITLPFALVPVLPNVPGFYLAYRFYCHIKALMGVKNLGYLLQTKGSDREADPTVDDTTHLTFKACSKLDIPYLADATFSKVKAEDNSESEQIILTHETIDRIVEYCGLTQLRDDLHKALKQSTARLKERLGEETVQ